jgi:4-amino-4-deoxy-L-arabinose transferase-like glycosyltransferase
MPRHKSFPWIGAIMLFGALVRIAFLVQDPYPERLSGLSAPNGEMARNILVHGEWFVINREAYELVQSERALIDPADIDYTEADEDPRFTPYSIQLPGPALVLAGLWKVTGDYRYIDLQVLQLLVDTAMIFLLYWVTLRLFRRRRAALVAAAAYAGLLPVAAFMTIPFYDAWAVFIPTAALALFLKADEAARPWPWLALEGLVVGFGLYFRFGLVLVPLILGLASLVRGERRRAITSALLPTVVALLVLAPYTIRNYATFDRFIPANTGFGQVLWQGLGEEKNSFGAVNSDEETAEKIVRPERPDLQYGTPEYDDFLRVKAVDAIREHPGHYVNLLARRFASATFLMHAYSADAYADLLENYRAKFGPLTVVAVGTIAVTDYLQGAVFVVAVITAFVVRRRFPRQVAVALAVPVGVLVVPLFLGFQWRYVLPGLPGYLVLAGLGVDILVERVRGEAIILPAVTSDGGHLPSTRH